MNQPNNQDMARIVPTHHIDWGDKMSIKSELLVSPEELIKPIEDIWEVHVKKSHAFLILTLLNSSVCGEASLSINE